MNYCKRCLLRDGIMQVTIDADGLCNYCSHYDRYFHPIVQSHDKIRFFMDRIDKLKGKYPYDALVGLSGGKDSTYVLYQLVKKYKLNVLAVTYDNSFLTDFALQNINTIVTKLQVEHRFYAPNPDIFRNFYTATMEKQANPCTACATGGYFLALKFCHENTIPFFFHGRTPYQMFNTLYDEMFMKIIEVNLQPHSFETIARTYRRILLQTREYIGALFNNRNDARNVLREFFLDPALLTDTFAPESLSYFLYHPYHEEEIKKEIARELGWTRPHGDEALSHHDCVIHDAAVYLARQVYGADLIETEIAVMLRMGDINLKEAETMKEKSVEKYDNLAASMQHLCKFCGISEATLAQVITKLREK
jgi:hypothetical protein